MNKTALPLLMSIAITACGGSDSDTADTRSDENRVIQVTATAEIATPSAVADLALLPIPFASWTSPILIAAENGEVFYTDALGTQWDPVEGSEDISRMAALPAESRENKSYVAGLTDDGSVIVWEYDSQQNFVVADGELDGWSREERQDQCVIFEPANTTLSTVELCPEANTTQEVGQGFALALEGDTGLLIESIAADMSYRLDVTGGFGVDAITQTPDGFAATTSPFGAAAFQNGVVVFVDNTSPRIVMLSLENLLNQITEPDAP